MFRNLTGTQKTNTKLVSFRVMKLAIKYFVRHTKNGKTKKKNVDKQKTAKNHTINSNNLEKYFIASRWNSSFCFLSRKEGSLVFHSRITVTIPARTLVLLLALKGDGNILFLPSNLTTKSKWILLWSYYTYKKKHKLIMVKVYDATSKKREIERGHREIDSDR